MAESVTEWIAETAIRHGAAQPGIGRQLVRESVRAGKFSARQLNLTQLAKACFGRDPEPRLSRFARKAEWVKESTDAVDASAFRDVIGAVAVEAVEGGYAEATATTKDLCGVWQSGTSNLFDEATIPYPYQAVDRSQDVAQGQEYPRTGFANYKIKAPAPQKHGLIAVLTLETVMSNRVTEFLDAHAEVGKTVGRAEARKILRVVLGLVNNYTRNGTTFNTYQTGGAWVNAIDDFNVLDGPAALDRAMQAFERMVDPVSGEEIERTPTAMFTLFGNRFSLKQAVSATEYRQTSPDGRTEVVSANPLDLALPVLTDPKARRLLLDAGLTEAQAASTTVIGDFPRAFKWREVEPFSTFEVNASDEDWTPGWSQDIVYACKARTWGTAFVYDPYAVIRLRKMA